MVNQVALVLNEEVDDPIRFVFNKMPVWILKTEKNESFIKSLHRKFDANTIITTFPRKDGENNSDLAERMLYTLDDHHNEHSFGEAYDTLLVSGLALTEAKTHAFTVLGFSEFVETDFGFVARKLQ